MEIPELALEDLTFPGLEITAIAYLEAETTLDKIMVDSDRTTMVDSDRTTMVVLVKTMVVLARIMVVLARIMVALVKITVEWDLIGEVASV